MRATNFRANFAPAHPGGTASANTSLSAPHAGTPRSSSAGRSGVQARSLRATNLSLVLRHVLTEPGKATRASIAQRTGITPATVSRLVDELTNAGLVTELPPIAEATRGRPAIRLAPAPEKVLALGLEVNVTGLDARVVDLGGTVIAEATLAGDYANSDPADTMAQLAVLARPVLDEALTKAASHEIEPLFVGAGLALPGLVSADALTTAPNLGWRDIPFDDLLAPMGDLAPVVVANEADLAAFAVSSPRPGSPTGPASFVYVSGEVGVGAGIVVDHHPMSGASGWSGEIGHVCTDPAGPVCSCGATGCLEAFLGRRALSRQAGLGNDATIADILAAAESGDEATLAALAEGAAALGRALAATVNLIDIPLVLLGGNIAELGPHLTEGTLAEMRMRVLQAPWQDPRVEAVPDSTWLAVTGAAHAVLQRLADDPLAWIG